MVRDRTWARLAVAGGAALIAAALVAPSAPGPSVSVAAAAADAPPANTSTWRQTMRREEAEQRQRDLEVERYLRAVDEENKRRAEEDKRRADADRAAREAAARAAEARAGRSASSGRSTPSAPSTTPSGNRAIGQEMAAARGWAGEQWECLDALWTNENSWRTDRGGIPQAKPASKMASAGPDWQTDAATQIRWGLGYIAGRYGTPCSAWSFWNCIGVCRGVRKTATWY